MCIGGKMNLMGNAFKTLENYGWKLQSDLKYEKANKTMVRDGILYYDRIPRALLQTITQEKKLNCEIPELGILLDVSRGPVFTVENLKKQICQIAMSGYTYIMLYVEDMLEIKHKQYGYLKGRYSKEEIKELDKFCSIFEIELIPCIQTLGHFADFLKWDKNAIYKDTDDIIMADNVECMNLIDKIIDFCLECFTTRKIHIGMDEAEGLGRGKYLDKYGYKRPQDIYVEHIDKMYTKFKECGYQEIIIWSDVPFSLNGEQYLYNNDPDQLILKVLNQYQDLKICYWTYGNETVEKQKYIIANHSKNIDIDRIIVAGGVNQWGTISYLSNSCDGFKTLVEASRQSNLKDVMATIWFDDGGYNNFYTTQYGIYDRSCTFYDLKTTSEMFNFVFGLNVTEIKQISEFSDNYIDHVKMLWDNPLIQMHYKSFKNKLDLEVFEKCRVAYPVSQEFEYQKQLINYIINKVMVQDALLKNLTIQTQEIDNIILQIDLLQVAFREYWLSLFKPNGMYIILLRFGEQKTIFEEIKRRIENEEELIELKELCDVSLSPLHKDVFYHKKV